MKLNYILATAGHVDHGKSSLVKALTGTDPDRLPEEKARGITIDLGFAHLELNGARNGQAVTYNLGLVDVPGHEDLVKNMVAGVGSVDLALLVVAADDGWMPQTEEHLQILSYLGISRGVVALTKIDLARDEKAMIESVRSKLHDTPLAQARIVPTSVTNGRGLDELKNALLDVLSQTPPPANVGKPRLPIDRVFTLQGVGVVVTGTLTGGELRRGQPVMIQPSLRRARIRSIHTHNQNVEANLPGTRTALNLSDVSVSEVQRGQVVVNETFTTNSNTWDVLLERSARASGRGIKDNALVRVHFGSANSEGRIVFLEAKNLSAGEKALAQIRFDEPVFAFTGDRFIIRDTAEQQTLAGGIILSAEADRRHFHTPERKSFLEQRSAQPNDPVAFVASEIERDQFTRKDGLLRNSRFSAAEIANTVQALTEKKLLVISGEFAADAKWWNELLDRGTNFIDRAHRERPNEAGASLNELRSSLDCGPDAFAALVSALCNSGFIQSGVTISRQTHRLELPPHLKNAAEKIRAALKAKPLDPPSIKEIAPDAAAQQALRFLLQTGEAVELSKEIVLTADAYKQAVGEVRRVLSERGSATTSELRQALSTSRRVIIPLLEYLDTQGITRREGDKRVLAKP